MQFISADTSIGRDYSANLSIVSLLAKFGVVACLNTFGFCLSFSSSLFTVRCYTKTYLCTLTGSVLVVVVFRK